jgi:hypothetical protein
MRGQSRALANILLERHRSICQLLGRHQPEDVDTDDIGLSVTTYGDVCERAGLGRGFARAAKGFLCEIAEWCLANGWPPLNALVVNKERGYPGDGYSEAPGCTSWESDVKCVIAFTDYPVHIEQ